MSNGAAISASARAIAELERRGAKRDRVGFIGPLGYRLHAQLAERFGKIADLGGAYMQRRLCQIATKRSTGIGSAR